MKYKKYIFIVVAIIVIVTCNWYIVFRYLPSKSGATISQIQLKSCMNAIARRYTNFYAGCEILTCNERFMLGSKNMDNRYDSYLFENMTNNERIIYFSGDVGLKKRLEPIQIYSLFESWLFIQDKKLPYNIIAMSWSYTSGGMDNTNDQMTIITKDEFENICQDTDISELNIQQAAQILSNKWIEKTGYVKK